MIVDYIKLKGFRSYTDQVTFDFNEGINVIIGANGSGKTTALKALRLLLLDKSDATLEEFVNRDSLSFNIEIKLSHLGHDYLTSLNYTLKNKISERELYIDDFERPKFNTTSSVKDYLKTIFDPELTYYAIALHQGSSEIIKAKDSARLELFKKIRDVDFNKQVEELKIEYDNLEKEDLNKVDLNLQALQIKSYQWLKKQTLPYSDDEIGSMNLQVENLILKIGSFDQKKEVEKAVSIQKIKKIDIQKSIETIEVEIKDIQDTLHNLITKDFTIQEKEILFLENNEFEDKSFPIEQGFIMNKEIKNLAVKSLKNQIADIDIKRVRLLDFSEETLSVNKIIIEYETEIKQINKTIESLKLGICPLCSKEITDAELKDYYITLQKIETVLSTNKLGLINLNSRKQENKEEVEVNNKLKEQKQQLQLNLDDSFKVIERFKEDYERDLLEEKKRYNRGVELNQLKLKQAKTTLLKDKENLETSIILNNTILGKALLQEKEYKDTLLEIENLRKNLEKKLEEFPVIDVFNLTLEKELLEKKTSTQKDVIAQNIQADDFNQKLEKEKQEDKKKEKNFLKEKDNINAKIQLLKEARTILLKHFPNFIISSSIEDTENSMNDFINIVYTKSLNIKLRSTNTALKMEYGEGRKLSCSNLSGAEEIISSLAFINSLNELLELKFLFMDEADAPLSEENTKTLFEAIQNMENYDQIIIITHQNTFKSALEVEGAKVFEVTEEGIK